MIKLAFEKEMKKATKLLKEKAKNEESKFKE